MTIHAFPFVQELSRQENESRAEGSLGMTLKDWFAGQIMVSMIGGSDSSFSNPRDDNGRATEMNQARLAIMAKNAYQAAEAMMLARSEK